MSLSDDDFLRELTIEAARNSAQAEAAEVTRRRLTTVSDVESKRILSKKSRPVVEDVKTHVREARGKDQMRTVSHYLCDRCDQTILNPEDGFIVQGNVYVADPSCRGGLIGNAFPNPNGDGTLHVDEIQETVFCQKCFLSALGLDKSKSYSLTSGNKRGI